MPPAGRQHVSHNIGAATRSADVPLITLASGSPRRKQLLALTGWAARVRPIAIDETARAGESPEELARRLALTKARHALERHGDSALVLAADTIVAADGQLLGKPADAGEAAAMLERLRGRTHRVVTAVALIDPRARADLIDVCTTDVPMRAYDDREIGAYVAGGFPLDKAGAYGIQDRPLQPVAVDELKGCYANVMGLPLCHLVRTMGRLGHVPPVDVPAACRAETGYDCPVYPQILSEEV